MESDFGVVGALFVAMAGPDMVNDMVHVDKSGAMCNGCAPEDQGTLDALSIQVGTVYCEVIGALALMVAAAVYYEGSRMRTFMTQLPFVCIQAKHIFVNGLIPPVPVMALAGIVLALGVYNAFFVSDTEGTDYSKYAFIGQFALNLAVFVMDPGQVVKDTWPDIDGAALGIGTLFIGVIQLYAAMFIVLFVLEAPLSHFVSMTLGMGQLYRDVVLNESGPPIPVLVLFIVVFLSSAYGFFVEGGAAKSRTD